METIKLSVIIPTYNSIAFLEDLWSDLKKQSYPNFEVIFVDDGSTDGSLEFLRSISDARVTVLESEHLGVSNARNIGLDAAKGIFIRFIDSDDRLPSDSFQAMLKAMEQDETIDLVLGNFTYEYSEDVYFTGDAFANETVEAKVFAQRFIVDIYSYYYGVVWNKLYKRALIEENKLAFPIDLSWGEDFDFNVRYFKHCNKVRFLSVPDGVYKYVQNSHSITNTKEELSATEIKALRKAQYQKALPFCEKNHLARELLLESNYHFIKYEMVDEMEKMGMNIFRMVGYYLWVTRNPDFIEYKEKRDLTVSFGVLMMKALRRTIRKQ